MYQLIESLVLQIKLFWTLFLPARRTGTVWNWIPDRRTSRFWWMWFESSPNHVSWSHITSESLCYGTECLFLLKQCLLVVFDRDKPFVKVYMVTIVHLLHAWKVSRLQSEFTWSEDALYSEKAFVYSKYAFIVTKLADEWVSSPSMTYVQIYQKHNIN